MYTYVPSFIEKCAELKNTLPNTPRVAVQLGSGLADSLSDRFEEVISFDLSKWITQPLPSTVGHTATLLYGVLEGVPAISFNGRLHLYESVSVDLCCRNVILAKLLGCETFICCNAAGALNPSYSPGDLVLIKDHINASGENPLVGAHDALNRTFGTPHLFINMHDAYDQGLLLELTKIAQTHKHELQTGIYAGVKGPSLETSAERRALRHLGADLVGMSTVNEVILARALEMRVLGMSVVTNMALGDNNQQADSIDDILRHAKQGGQLMTELLSELLKSAEF